MYTDGPHELRVIAYDTLDHSAEAAIMVMVSNAGGPAVAPTGGTTTPAQAEQVQKYNPIPFWSCTATTGAPSPLGGVAMALMMLAGLAALRRRQ